MLHGAIQSFKRIVRPPLSSAPRALRLNAATTLYGGSCAGGVPGERLTIGGAHTGMRAAVVSAIDNACHTELTESECQAYASTQTFSTASAAVFSASNNGPRGCWQI